MSRLLVTSSAVVLTCALVAFAQKQPQPAANPAGSPPAASHAGAAPGQWKNADHAMASCVAAGNQAEIAIAQFASEKTTNEEVQNFAMMLVRDHKDYLQKLAKFAPEATRDGYIRTSEAKEARATNPPNKTPAATTPATRATQPAAVANNANNDPNNPNRVQYTAGFRPGDANQFPHAQIEHELAQQCVHSTEEMLNAKTGAEFDKCFIGAQIGAHAHMRDKLIVYQRHASGELGQVLAAGQKKVEEHLAKAEDLMKKLDSSAAETPRKDGKDINKDGKETGKDGAKKTTSTKE